MKTALFVFPESRQPADDPRIVREAVEDAVTAERLGSDAVFLAEHHFDGTAAYTDPTTFAMAITQRTSRIQIGFAVLQASLYHPLRLAEQLSLLDILSNGRVIVGLGKGSAVNTHEYDGFQIHPEDARDRYMELEGILARLFTEQRVIHDGKYWQFDIPMLRPRPLTPGGPQLYRACTNDEAIKAQADRGQPVLFSSRPNPEFQRRIDLYTDTMSAAGFGDAHVRHALAQSWVWKQAIIDETDAGAIEDGLRYFDLAADYRALFSDKYAERPRSRGQIPDGMLCGSPQTVREQIGDLADTGIGGLIVKFAHGPTPHEYAMAGFQMFMEHIRPTL